MAVVQDSNLISFSSTQLITFQTVFSSDILFFRNYSGYRLIISRYARFIKRRMAFFLRNKADNLPQALHMRRRGDKIKDDALRFNICLNGGHRPVVIYKRRDVYAFT